jgi:hypothetical protein
MKLLDRLSWIFAVTGGLVVVGFVLLLAINWHDRAPSATVREFEKALADRPAVADTDNAYLMLLGFGAPPDKDPLAIGAARLDWIGARSGATGRDSSGDPLPNADDHSAVREPDIAALLNRCGVVGDNCLQALDAAVSNKTSAARWLSDEAWLLERYETLLDEPAFREVDDRNHPFAPALPYKMVRDAQLLYLLSVYLAAARGDVDSVQAALNDDLAFWRMVLADSNQMLSKFIAGRIIIEHLQFGNLALRKLQAHGARNVIPEQWLASLNDAERSIYYPVINQWQQVRWSLTTDETGSDKAASDTEPPLWQTQDILNLYAENLKQQLLLLDVPYPDMPDAVIKANKLASPESWRWDWIYDPLGKRFLKELIFQKISTFAASAADLEGARRAAVVTSLLRDQGVPPASVRISLWGAELRNPYTGVPFAWSEDTGEIVFEGLKNQMTQEYRFKY